MSAKDKNSKNSFNDFQSQIREAARKAQAEMERQRREQEKARREAERARQQAQRETGRRQDDWGKNGWGNSNKNSASPSPAKRDAKTPDNDDERDKTGGGPRNADVDLDDFDLDANVAQQQVRAMEKTRHRAMQQAQREQELLRLKEQARTDRIRQRAVRKLPGLEDDARTNDRAPPSPREDIAKKPPSLVPAAVIEAEKPSDAAQKRRTKLLDGLQEQASHLGMGTGKDRDADTRDAVTKDERGRDDEPRWGRREGAKNGAPAVGDKDDKTPEGEIAVRALKQIPFPGRERGAEMPADLYVKERRDELIVGELSEDDLKTAEAHGFSVGRSTVLGGSAGKVQRLRGPSGVGRDEAERELHKVLPFLSVTPNHAYNIYVGSLGETEGASGAVPVIDRRKIVPASAEPCPDNTCFGGQLIKWKSALSSCTKDVRIGVIDTSFDVGHPAFKHVNAIQGEFLDGERPSPYDWHGTAVLSVLAGDQRSGTPGLVPDATFLLATTFRSDAAGNASTDTVRLLAALAWLEELDVDIVNMSFSGPQDPAFERAIERMSKKGIVFIAAAGNMGPTAAPSYPAAYPDVIAVTAVNRRGENYRSANRGSYIDVSAPGVDILTALPDAQQGYRTGTSFAVPFVTAILATRGADAGAGGAKQHLLQQLSMQDLGPPGRDPIYGAGLALAPARCPGRGDAVASGSDATAPDSWSTRTTLIKAGAAFGP